MSDQNRDDNFDSLLDSLSGNEEIEKKMDDFARNKERIERIQRARETSEQFQQTYSSAARNKARSENEAAKNGTPQVIYTEKPGSAPNGSDSFFASKEETAPSAEDQYAQNAGMTREFGAPQSAPAQPGEQTRVFNGAAPAEEDEIGQTKPVTMHSDEIAGLLEKDEPLLHREYVREDEDDYYDDYDDSYDDEEDDYDDYDEEDRHVRVRHHDSRGSSRPAPSRSSHSRKKSKNNMRTVGIIAGIALAIAVVSVGGYMAVHFMNSGAQTQTSKGYNDLLSWAESFNGLTDDNKQQVLDFRSVYDKLSEDEKRKINEQLLARTSKTFDELLAEAGAQQKPSSSNSDVKNAERKAELRDEIESLSGDVAVLQGKLDGINKRKNDAENTYNSKKNAYDQAVQATNTAQSKVNQIQDDLNSYPSADSIRAQIKDLQDQINAINAGDGSDTGGSGADKEQLQSQINSLQKDLDSVNSLNSQLSSATNTLIDAQRSESDAKSSMDSAYNDWQAIVAEASPVETEINNKNNKINELQSEYDSID